MYSVVCLLKLEAHRKLLITIKFWFTMQDEGFTSTQNSQKLDIIINISNKYFRIGLFRKEKKQVQRDNLNGSL